LEQVFHLDDLLSHLDKKQVAGLFADFLMDNIDLVRQIESSFRAGNGGRSSGPPDRTGTESAKKGLTGCPE